MKFLLSLARVAKACFIACFNSLTLGVDGGMYAVLSIINQISFICTTLVTTLYLILSVQFQYDDFELCVGSYNLLHPKTCFRNPPDNFVHS